MNHSPFPPNIISGNIKSILQSLSLKEQGLYVVFLQQMEHLIGNGFYSSWIKKMHLWNQESSFYHFLAFWLKSSAEATSQSKEREKNTSMLFYVVAVFVFLFLVVFIFPEFYFS